MREDDKAKFRTYIERNLPRARREQRIGLFVAHFVPTLVLTIIAWITAINANILSGEMGLPAMIMLTVAAWWGVFMQVLSLTLVGTPYGERDLRRDLLVEARIHRMIYGADADEFLDATEPEKLKRGTSYTLNDDGEIDLIDEVNDSPTSRRASGTGR
ncbi:MAG: hypothetical protein OHK0023_05820 [Anaerolineae bacterium]